MNTVSKSGPSSGYGIGKETQMAEETATVARSQMWKHEAMVEWLTEQGFITPKSSQVEVVAAAFAHRVEWRKSERYLGLENPAAAEREAAREKREAERAAKAEEREAAKAKRAEEREAARAAKAAEKEAAKATKAAAAQKSTAASKQEAPAKATKATKKSAPADDPFA